jgi:hypothetical protein
MSATTPTTILISPRSPLARSVGSLPMDRGASACGRRSGPPTLPSGAFSPSRACGRCCGPSTPRIGAVQARRTSSKPQPDRRCTPAALCCCTTVEATAHRPWRHYPRSFASFSSVGMRFGGYRAADQTSGRSRHTSRPNSCRSRPLPGWISPSAGSRRNRGPVDGRQRQFFASEEGMHEIAVQLGAQSFRSGFKRPWSCRQDP